MSRSVLLSLVHLAPGCAAPEDPGVDQLDDADADSGTVDSDTACVPEPLPDGWAGLTLSPLGGTRDVQPDTTNDLWLSVIVFGTPTAVDLCQTWSVDPPDAGIEVVGDQFVVDAATPDGTAFTVTATIPAAALGEDADLTLTLPGFVYDPALRPWVGGWHEVAQLDCASGERPPEAPIGEILIRAGGSMTVTWSPFEVYVDYWAEQTFLAGADPGAGEVELQVTGGNYLPADVDGEGTYRMEGDDLILEDLWLGTPNQGTAPAGCGHRLR